MHFTVAIAAAAALLSLCSATPVVSNYVLHEKRATSRAGLVKRTKLNGGFTLPVRVGLAQNDLHMGYDWLMDVSHPDSPRYGQHWSIEEVNKAFAPTAETVQVVRDWLISEGIPIDRITVSDNKGWLAFDSTVDEAERLFRTEYYHHEHHTNSAKYLIGCDEYYLPEHVREHVDYITPGVKDHVFKRNLAGFSKAKRSGRSAAGKAPLSLMQEAIIAKKNATVPINCSYYEVSADCIRALYNIPPLDLTKQPNPDNTIGVYEGDEEAYSQADLNLFFENLAPFISQGTRPDLDSVDGGVAPVAQKDDGGEAMLDLTILYSFTYPQTIEYFQVDDPYWEYYSYGFGDTFLDALDGSFCTYSAFGQKGDNNTLDPIYPDPRKNGYKGNLQCGKYTPPKVISISYLGGEQELPVNYVERQCNEWMKLGLQGTTVLYASGDYGVAPFPGSYNQTDGCLGNGSIFAPTLFVDCPYVLGVGATEIKKGLSGYSANPEQAVFNNFYDEPLNYTSAGGFSNVFPRPDYQKTAVQNYFAVQNPPYPYYSTTKGKNIGANGGLYNRIGRGFPDVSANGAWWLDWVQGYEGIWGGTSMATPIWASIIYLINDARMAAGKSSVGFINPTLYANTWAFHDITSGFNNGCGTKTGFMTAPGWDPVTGLGTPNFPKLKQLFMSMP